jgi:hypothetical protein
MAAFADGTGMDAPADKTIRLSEGETEMLMRALVEAAEQQPRSQTGETQFIKRQAESAPNEPSGSIEPLQKSNFIL